MLVGLSVTWQKAVFPKILILKEKLIANFAALEKPFQAPEVVLPLENERLKISLLTEPLFQVLLWESSPQRETQILTNN